MNQKLRQVTDRIHGTIYLSEFESALISTPFFYRLNDVYQCSTVYLTFPSNRTKRYEHSLGVMHLTSQVFFFAVANSDSSTCNQIFSSLLQAFNIILNDLDKSRSSKYYNRIENYIANCLLKNGENKENRDRKLSLAMHQIIINDDLKDQALGHYIPNCFQHCCQQTLEEGIQSAKKQFVYQCVLQAIRIAALFHDVGHPPYSHIIETIMQELYTLCKKDKSKGFAKFQPTKANELISCLDRFLSTSNKSKLNFILLSDQTVKATQKENDFHENVGYTFLKLAAEQCIPEIFETVASSRDSDEKKAIQVLYYITIIEFVFAIITDANPFFQSLHRIIAGLIDTDKLDYIMRDTSNSGVDWGSVPYERILESVKFIKEPESDCALALAFPRKISDDLDDIIIARYKVYTRINYHHRSMKTSLLLQYSVKELALDYLLSSDSESAICPEINTLWTALNYIVGDDRQNIKVIQWNDSWLITALYRAFVNLYQGTKTAREGSKIENYLQEVLLNKKHYYSLLKRKCDAIDLAKAAVEKSGIKIEWRQDLIQRSKDLLSSANRHKSQPMGDFFKLREAIDRLNILEYFISSGNFELLDRVFPFNIENEIKRTLNKLEKAGTILDYAFIMNPGRNNTGIQKYLKGNSGIYLYDQFGNSSVYDVASALKDQVKALSDTCLGFHVYIGFPKTASKTSLSISAIFTKVAQDLGVAIRKSFDQIIKELIPEDKLS